MPIPRNFFLVAAWMLTTFAESAEISRIWLSHERETPRTITVNWETVDPAESVVEFGATAALGEKRRSAERKRLHNLEIPFSEAGVHYRVRSGHAASEIHHIEGYSGDE